MSYPKVYCLLRKIQGGGRHKEKRKRRCHRECTNKRKMKQINVELMAENRCPKNYRNDVKLVATINILNRKMCAADWTSWTT